MNPCSLGSAHLGVPNRRMGNATLQPYQQRAHGGVNSVRIVNRNRERDQQLAA